MSVAPHCPSPDELRGLLAHVIAGVAGGGEAKWKRCVGPVEKLPIVFNVQCNWRVTPNGSAREREVIGRAVEIVRAEHPYVE